MACCKVSACNPVRTSTRSSAASIVNLVVAVESSVGICTILSLPPRFRLACVRPVGERLVASIFPHLCRDAHRVCHSNDFHQIESPQVSDCQTPKEKSSCPERGIGHVGTAFSVAMTPRASRRRGRRGPPPHGQVRPNPARRVGTRHVAPHLVEPAESY